MLESTPNQIKQGCIVEYLQDKQIVIGCAVQSAQRDFRLLNINKRILKLSISRILPWKGPLISEPNSRENILEAILTHDQHRKKIQQDLNPQEIWEVVQGEIEEGSIDWFADLLWEDPEIDSIAALGRALLCYKMHFKFVPPKFIIYDYYTVEEKKRQEEARRKEAHLISNGQDFLKALWDKNYKGDQVLPDLPGDIESELKDLLLKGVSEPENSEFQRLWPQLSKNLPPQEHMPLMLCQLWGLLPPHYNYLLDQADYSWGDDWAQAFQEEITRHKREIEQSRQIPENSSLVSIDSYSTTDIDDAFQLEYTESSGYRLQLAFACPSLFWDFNSQLDRAVASRCSSIYLPEGTTHMLPERLSTDLYSLHAQENKPVLLMELILDSNADLKDIDLKLTWSKIDQNLTYNQVETMLQEGNAFFRKAVNLAQKLKQKRLMNGAVIFEQQEPLIKIYPLNDDSKEVEVLLKEPTNNPQAQLIVSEFMILANMAASIWAQQKSVPLVHRCQEIYIPSESKGVWSDPVEIFYRMREMSSSKLSTEPGFHTSLGVSSYAPITSPLRRYADLLNIAQILAYLFSKPPFSKEELDSRIIQLNSRTQTITRIQRYRLRYWKLLYLQRCCKTKTCQAIIVAQEDKMVNLVLPQENIYLRAPKNILGDKIQIGKKYRVQLGKISPLNNEIKVQKAWEEE